jgi:hypothetical protein
MEQILGIPPMNQMDAMAPLMTECFTDKPDFRPYTCLPNRITLDEMPGQAGIYYGKGETVAKNGLHKDFLLPDQIKDDKLNRVIWQICKGPDTPYPEQFAGAHGKGLKALGLTLTGDEEEDDD